MIETSERTRSGYWAASVWAIIPPMETPTTCTGSSSSASISPTVSRVMSVSVYCSRSKRRRASCHWRGGGKLAREERPTVAVVEAHDEVAAGREALAERHRPADHLGAQALDEHDRRIGRIAEGLITERHPAADVAEALRVVRDEAVLVTH